MTEMNAERAVIGALVTDARMLRQVMSECTPADFADTRLARIYEGIMHMQAQREPIDMITVEGKLAGWGVHEIGLADLDHWKSAIPTAEYATSYAQKVRTDALGRGLRELATTMQQESRVLAPDEAISNAIGALKGLREHHVVDELPSMTLDQVLTQEVEYDWVIEGLIERRDRAMFTAAEGAGKTTLMRQMSICAAAGIHPFTEGRIDPQRVLVVDAENSEIQWGRETRRWAPSIDVLKGDDPYKRLRLACTPRLDLATDMGISKGHRLIDQHDPSMVVIGPLYRLTRALNNDDDAAPLLAALDTIRDRGIAMLIEAHAGHQTNPSGERDLRPRGSSQLMGWPEFGYGLRRNKKNPLHVDVVRWRGDRDSRGWPSKLARAKEGLEATQRWPWRPVEY